MWFIWGCEQATGQVRQEREGAGEGHLSEPVTTASCWNSLPQGDCEPVRSVPRGREPRVKHQLLLGLAGGLRWHFRLATLLGRVGSGGGENLRTINHRCASVWKLGVCVCTKVVRAHYRVGANNICYR